VHGQNARLAVGNKKIGATSTKNVSTRARIAILAAWGVGAAALLLGGWSAPGALEGVPEGASGEVASARNWLAAILGGYVVNYAVAWRYRASWTVTLVRSLIWAVAAYICISDIVDIFGENWDHAGQILGGDGQLDPDSIGALRLRLAFRVVGLVSSALCIGVGFEKEAEEESAGEGEGGATS